ncbi:MAG: histone deacetylase [Phycisphaeraceae bacterium]
MKPVTALMYDPISKAHDTGPGHPERPSRCDAVIDALQQGCLYDQMLRIEAREAEMDELVRCHDKDYLAQAQREIESGREALSTGDTMVCPATWQATIMASGGVMNAVDAVMAGRADNAFCVVRPPGHHAMPAVGMGFCVVNHVAVAARYAQRKHGVDRVLIADWDVHHGNGTQDIFYDDGSVFFFSTHQSPWYPGTGAADEHGKGKGRGTTLNCPMLAGSGRHQVLGAFLERLVPAMQEFQPELVLISAGFDSRIDDPLGRFMLTDDDFVELTKVLRYIANDYAGGRMISVLEGGYSLDGLASAAAAHVKVLMGQEKMVEYDDASGI